MTDARFDIVEDDLEGAEVRALLRLHLEGMLANSPPGQVFAFDLSGLRAPGVTVWSARAGGAILGVGALRDLGDGAAELKSMRTHPDHARRGVGRAILEHIIGVARSRGTRRLLLETGSGAAFEPALALYRRRGFVETGPFADYEKSAFNQFLALDL
jgi:putative acetyltransferase